MLLGFEKEDDSDDDVGKWAELAASRVAALVIVGQHSTTFNIRTSEAVCSVTP